MAQHDVSARQRRVRHLCARAVRHLHLLPLVSVTHHHYLRGTSTQSVSPLKGWNSRSSGSHLVSAICWNIWKNTAVKFLRHCSHRDRRLAPVDFLDELDAEMVPRAVRQNPRQTRLRQQLLSFLRLSHQPAEDARKTNYSGFGQSKTGTIGCLRTMSDNLHHICVWLNTNSSRALPLFIKTVDNSWFAHQNRDHGALKGHPRKLTKSPSKATRKLGVDG